MKKHVLMKSIFGVTLFLTACPSDDGNDDGSGETKLEMCKTLWSAYCDSAVRMGCAGATMCEAEKHGGCESQFDGSCAATTADKEMVEHDIDMIIGSKTTCDGLQSIESYEQDKVDDMKSAGCGTGGGGLDTGPAVGGGSDTSDGVVIDPNLDVTAQCQQCVQTNCPAMHAECQAEPGCTDFINEVCDCACNASEDFFGLFVCILLSASDNSTDVQSGAENLASCISDPGAPCASSCPSFGCQCTGGGVIDDCNFCIAETCMDQSIACFNNLECVALIDCVGYCGDDEACIDECGVSFPTGVNEFVNLVTCVADGCPGECNLY